MKTILLYGLLMIAFIGSPAVAQYSFETDNAQIKQVVSRDYMGRTSFVKENSVYLNQSGLQNQTNVKQTAGDDGANYAGILQYGNSQSVDLIQQGSNNVAHMGQFGRQNEIDISQYGDFINTNVLQSGHDNSVSQDFTGSNLDYTIIQFGNNWGLTIIGSPSIPGFSVKQSGMSGTPVTIEHH
jgi:hypothetical protein